jgi:high-affinity nickel-transport protein
VANGIGARGSGWRSLAGRERRQVAMMLATVAALNLGGWGLFVLAVLPRHFRYAGLGVGIGVALTAWTLGGRHAFDADHIAAIDNTTRKLLAEGRRPLGTGFFFALGHSSIVLVVGTAIALAARPVFHAVAAPRSPLAALGGVTGTALSALFLWLVAAMNLVVLAGIVRVFRAMRHGRFTEEQLEAQLQARGFVYRFLGRWAHAIRRPRDLFFVGLLFGIGFDTATEVLLLAGTAAAATQGLALEAVLALPLLFAGGLTLCDSLDGIFMNTAYGWAFARPVRKVFYNLTVTGLSVAVAFLIGGIEIAALVSTELHLHGWLAHAAASLDLNTAGYLVVGLFVVVWAGALIVWRVGRIEARWEAAAAAAREAA